MPRVYPGLYDRYDDASRAVADLHAAGVPADDISLIRSNVDQSYVPVETEPTPAGTGAKIGTVLGGGLGLLTGLGIMAIPGVGPVVAAGWLASTIAGAAVGAVAGAATGGIVGALTEHGVSEEHAHVYAEGVRRGGTLVTARGDENSRLHAGSDLSPHRRGRSGRPRARLQGRRLDVLRPGRAAVHARRGQARTRPPHPAQGGGVGA